MEGVPSRKKGRVGGQDIYCLSFGQVQWDRTPRWVRHGSDPEKPEFTDIKKKPVRVGLSRSNREMLGPGRMERWGKGCRN